MGDFAVKLPGNNAPIHCANAAEVKQTLEDYSAQNPGTNFANVMVHEMSGTSTTGTERSVFDFVQ